MVSEDKQQILDIKVKYEDAIYGIIRYKEKIDQLKQSIKDLQQQEKDLNIQFIFLCLIGLVKKEYN